MKTPAVAMRAIRAAAAGLALAILASPALGQGAPRERGYPDRSVHLYVNYVPGGFPDTVARLIAPRLSERWGRPVTVENKPGANGNIGADFVAKSRPDGYVLLFTGNSTLAINPFLYSRLPFDPDRDIVPVSLSARAPLFLALHPSVAAGTFQDLLALARARPGQLAYGSSGIGSTHHLSMEYLKWALDLDITHVPFKGTGQSVPATVAGQVPIVLSAYPTLAAFAKDGRLKLLAANSLKRPAFAPNIPAMSETVPGFDFAPNVGFFAPAGLPREVMARLSTDAADVARLPELVARMAALGVEAVGSTPEEYAASLRADAERYARAVKISGAKAE